MSRIYKRTDRIAVKIDDVVVKLAPLTLDHKIQVQQAMLNGHQKSDLKEATRGISLAIKYSLKGIEGVEDSDGNPYKLEFDDESNLSDSCVDDLMNVEFMEKLALVCSSMAKGVPNNFDQLKGVELVKTVKETSGNA